MDHDDTPIIKSGAKRFVQIALGAKDAKSLRNVVTSNADAPIKDCWVKSADPLACDGTALRQAIEQAPQELDPDEKFLVESTAGIVDGRFVTDESHSLADRVLVPEDVGVAQTMATVPLPFEADTSQEVQVTQPRSVAEPPALMSEVPVVVPTSGYEIGAQLLQVDHHYFEEIEDQVSLIYLGNQVPSVENWAQIPEDFLAHKLREITLEALEGASLADADMDNVFVDSGALVGPMPASESEFPLKVATHPSKKGVAEEIKESALMSRLKALKSNMSATESLLSKLDQTTPSKPSGF